uniref:uncharacterized protein LOC122604700 n=1 Tax=Erigeron canadensis TaxID=72917 RepID=UPI001CB8912C|nr:uncharacterized protein LOC122604700 [Erigeron canadensis]
MTGSDKDKQTTTTTPFHPATTVTNIRNHIPIILDSEEGNYNSWMALFKVQCTACKVLDHLTPPATESSSTATPTPSNAEWLRLDAIVLQWIYITITPNLLTTILHPDDTAAQA